MDKQKKQLIILVVLIAVAAVVGIFMLNRGPDAPPAPPPGDPAAQQPAPGAAGGAPAAGTPAAGAPGTAPAPLEDLKTPDLTLPSHREVSVDPQTKDPLRVLNPDVVFKQTAREIQELRDKWQVTGIAVAGKEEVITPVINPDGTKGENKEIREIWACFFSGNPRYYREGDRLEGTYFKVRRIVFNYRDAFVEVEGDTGAIVKLLVITNDRYGQKQR